ncbi:hypothetical protein BDW75DRAFT_245932 [Aspergillus navahoensis]
MENAKRQDQAIEDGIGSHLVRYGPAETKMQFRPDGKSPVLVENMLEFQYTRNDTFGRDTPYGQEEIPVNKHLLDPLTRRVPR